MKLQLRKAFVCLLVLGSALLLMGASTDGEPQAPPSPESFPSKVVWTPDGKHIIFSRGYQGIFMIDVAGSELQAIPADAQMGTPSFPGNALPTLSPDGTQLAYVASQGGSSQSAAIMISALDGAGARRLTHDDRFNTHPEWSPDGENIAFIADSKLAVMRADGTNAQVLAPSVVAMDAAPEWSPNGGLIAFVGTQDNSKHHNAIYTVRSDGTELTKLGPTVSVPSWSPDESRLAVLMPEDGEEVSLIVLNSIGDNPVKVVSLGKTDIWADNLSWSPDGNAILLASADGTVVVVSLEDAKERIIHTAGRRAAWSHDGARIAVLTGLNRHGQTDAEHPEVLYTVMWDGRFRRALAVGNETRMAAKYSGWYDVSRNIAACGQGYVVSDPVAKGFILANPFKNSGLVEDCKTLMVIRDRLAGDFLLNWNAETPITDWWGIGLNNSVDPDRVAVLWFPHPYLDSGLADRDTSSIISLAFIHTIVEGPSFSYRLLNGSIPPEMGNFPRLTVLDLSDNELSSSIPPELGNLTSLLGLDLSNNDLTGSLPPELGDITDSGIRVNGAWIKTGLVALNLSNNYLFGSIPPELGNLTGLQWLILSNNELSGSIPPELGNLSKLRELYLEENAFTGCVPAGLVINQPTLVVETDGLEFCIE